MLPKCGANKPTGKELSLESQILIEFSLKRKDTAPMEGSNGGMNGNLTEHLTQGQNDPSDNVEAPPSAGAVSSEKAVLCDGVFPQKDRSLVIKELGISSKDFIGPLCRPQTPDSKTEVQPGEEPKSEEKPQPKPDLENELSEFYKELDELEPVDCVDGSTFKDVDERDGRAWGPQNQSPCGETVFPKDQDSRFHPYRHGNGDSWHPRRYRPNFPQGPGWGGPDHPCHSGQWQHSQDFRGPHWGPHPGFPRPRHFWPPGPPPPPPHPPPGPAYPPDFGPQDCSSPVYPADGRADDGGNCCPSEGEAAWAQPHADSDWRQHHKPEPEPEPHPEPEKEHDLQQHGSQISHSDCDYRPSPFLLLILMRGLPGSGKTTLAKKLLSSGPNGLVLSTDDYFSEDHGYSYSPSLIGDAHDWNQKRARNAMDAGRSPVIIDNTNTQAWEMKPYVEMALERGYSIDFHEPDTTWKLDPFELEKRNKHGVPSKKIAQMLDRFEAPISVDIVLKSEDPPHKTAQGPLSRCPPSSGVRRVCDGAEPPPLLSCAGRLDWCNQKQIGAILKPGGGSDLQKERRLAAIHQTREH
ncbi:hypothetical protein GJAV_G00050960 [Gymnothorax javanicus]|nr:hypothetical protein GJAV_G00050960 [Gymnothorax javanicus]